MASYQETKNRAMRLYPMLFSTERHVWHHLFFVNGNGYEWQGGELVDPCQKSDTDVFKDRARYQLSLYKEADHFDERMIKRLDRSDPKIAELAACAVRRAAKHKTLKRLARSKGLTVAGKWLTEQERESALPPVKSLYPLCEYADILHVPDDVKPDWLEAAQDALAWAMSDEVEKTIGDVRYLSKARRLLTRIQRQRASAVSGQHGPTEEAAVS